MKKKFYKTKKVTKCFCCGSDDLKFVNIDPEALDDTAEWKEYTTGYLCTKCEVLNSTDGKERTYQLLGLSEVSEIMKFTTATDPDWGTHKIDARELIEK